MIAIGALYSIELRDFDLPCAVFAIHAVRGFFCEEWREHNNEEDFTMKETIEKKAAVAMEEAAIVVAMADLENALKAANQTSKTRTIRDALARVKAFNFCLKRQAETGRNLLAGVDDAIIQHLTDVLDVLRQNGDITADVRAKALDAMTLLEP